MISFTLGVKLIRLWVWMLFCWSWVTEKQHYKFFHFENERFCVSWSDTEIPSWQLSQKISWFTSLTRCFSLFVCFYVFLFLFNIWTFSRSVLFKITAFSQSFRVFQDFWNDFFNWFVIFLQLYVIALADGFSEIFVLICGQDNEIDFTIFDFMCVLSRLTASIFKSNFLNTWNIQIEFKYTVLRLDDMNVW